jgi:HD-GYP domain-containing protein (c-di-GMP phosphodiesterase class II)
LAGDELALIPRIIGVADTFDAMTTDRPYRRALTPAAAAAEIARLAGAQFCPHVAAAFARLYASDAFTLEQGERLLASLSALVPQA